MGISSKWRTVLASLPAEQRSGVEKALESVIENITNRIENATNRTVGETAQPGPGDRTGEEAAQPGSGEKEGEEGNRSQTRKRPNGTGIEANQKEIPGVDLGVRNPRPDRYLILKAYISNAQTLEIEGIPSNWSVAAKNLSGAFFSKGDNYVGWVWPDNVKSRRVSVTFKLPEKGISPSRTITGKVQNSNGTIRTATVTVSPVSGNQPPIAEAGGDYSIEEGASLHLESEASRDPDGNISKVKWMIVEGGGSVEDGMFHAPSKVSKEKQVLVRLVVTDNRGLNSSDTAVVNVTPSNSPPDASAGEDLHVNEDSQVYLNGSGSSDPDGEPLSYSWTQIEGLPVTLLQEKTVTPSFTAPEVNTTRELRFRLKVKDQEGATSTDTVRVTVENATPTSYPDIETKGGNVTAGSSINITLSIENSQTAELEGIPTEWSIVDKSTEGAFFSKGDNYVGWVWSEDQKSQKVHVVLGLPSSESAADYTLTANVEDSDGNKDSTRVTVSVAS
ncbi:MAG: PKD domain-containing protein [Candidatus Nanohaloarchaea archaeon]|nr:PKD domain-containing protein [Candidatus Nanohaloarchaea archaeon]